LKFARARAIIRLVALRRRLALLSLALCVTARAAQPAADWPQFLGPTRDGVYAGHDLADKWPAGGPKVLWEKKIGAGWSGPVVAGGRLILFHRVGDKERVDCLDAATGKEFWFAEENTAYRDDFGFDEGPRATPVIAGDRVFTFGAEGRLTARDLASGKPLWQIDTRKEFQADKGFFGHACSPLVEGDAVILNLGGKTADGRGAGIAAFDAARGKLLWQATGHEAGYSSPIVAGVAGKRYLFDLTRAGLVALDPKTGAVAFEYPFRASSRASVNAATPVIAGDQIFISASYGTGAALLRFHPDKPTEIWANDDTLSCHYATPAYKDAHLYGFDGRQEQGCNLRCVELSTGKIKWNENGLGAGTLMLAGDDLLILHEHGELIRAAATPSAFTVKSRAQVLKDETRATPALAGGLYFARDKSRLVCVDLRKN
jgi:outer membrane protein assembly factor BamB